MGHRKYRTSTEWKTLIEEQLASGLTCVAFCNELGLSAKTFYKQRQRYRRDQFSSGSGGFVQVQSSPSRVVPSQAIVLHYRDSRLELSSGISPVWVAGLMRALA
jgi:hypothetical protein